MMLGRTAQSRATWEATGEDHIDRMCEGLPKSAQDRIERGSAAIMATGKAVESQTLHAHQSVTGHHDYNKFQSEVMLPGEELITSGLAFEHVKVTGLDGQALPSAASAKEVSQGMMLVTNKRLIFISRSPLSRSSAKLVTRLGVPTTIKVSYEMGDINWYQSYPLAAIRTLETKMQMSTVGKDKVEHLVKCYCTMCACCFSWCYSYCSEDTCCCYTALWEANDNIILKHSPSNTIKIGVIDEFEETKKMLLVTLPEFEWQLPEKWEALFMWISALQSAAPQLNPPQVTMPEGWPRVPEVIPGLPRDKTSSFQGNQVVPLTTKSSLVTEDMTQGRRKPPPPPAHLKPRTSTAESPDRLSRVI